MHLEHHFGRVVIFGFKELLSVVVVGDGGRENAVSYLVWTPTTLVTTAKLMPLTRHDTTQPTSVPSTKENWALGAAGRLWASTCTAKRGFALEKRLAWTCRKSSRMDVVRLSRAELLMLLVCREKQGRNWQRETTACRNRKARLVFVSYG
jgi:hypothetical protein